ncbi:hypothetical protein [Catellatospora tritici]|uniref:hypothetical protein n=1 Tax=Catellatospora tritici TaxID=2851566 RepID=UPI001C2D0F95|nr:hypothetical protein [Catellatospora tritici]MBV1854786.1 hypothetical protein [Catellatospora tritici]
MTQAPTPQAPAKMSLDARIARAVGLTGHLLLCGWYAVSGLVTPVWGVVVLMIVWTALLVVCVRWMRPHPWRVPAVPVVAIAFWFAFVSAGEAWLGWTA